MKIPREEFLAQAKQREEYCDRLFEKYRDERCNDSLTEFLEIQKPLMYHSFVKIRHRTPEDFEEAWDDGVILLFRRAERFDSSKGHATPFFWYHLRDAFSRIFNKRRTLTRRGTERHRIRLVNFTDLAERPPDDFLFESTIQDREDGAKYAETCEHIRWAIGILEGQYRIIAERYLAGGTTKEIAEELGVTTVLIQQRRREIREAFYHDDDNRLRWLSRAGRRRSNKTRTVCSRSFGA